MPALPVAPSETPPTQWREPAQFARLFRHYHAPLARYAQRITGEASLAADVLQDVFMKLWERRTTLEATTSVQALLYTMVRNRALKVHRRAKWAAPDVDVADAADTTQAVASSAAQLAADDLQRHVRRWINDLPPRRAEAFTLSRYHNLSYKEIARIMGVSERTVETHILLALRELRLRLDQLENKDLSP